MTFCQHEISAMSCNRLYFFSGCINLFDIDMPVAIEKRVPGSLSVIRTLIHGKPPIAMRR
jgi:hypothetical protein